MHIIVLAYMAKHTYAMFCFVDDNVLAQNSAYQLVRPPPPEEGYNACPQIYFYVY